MFLIGEVFLKLTKILRSDYQRAGLLSGNVFSFK